MSRIVIRVIHLSFICSFIESEKTLDSIGLSFESFIFTSRYTPLLQVVKNSHFAPNGGGRLARCFCFQLSTFSFSRQFRLFPGRFRSHGE